MVNSDSPAFKLGEKIGHAIVAYIGVHLVIKGIKVIIKSSKALLINPPGPM